MATKTSRSLAPRTCQGDDPEGPKSRLPPSNPVCAVLYIDSKYCVVDKPPDVRIDGDFVHTVEKFVANAVRERNTDTTAIKVRNVNRLDYATSGVMICSLSRLACGVAGKQFEDRQVDKTYLALLHGHVRDEESNSAWEWPIADGDGFYMELGSEKNPGRPAFSTCEVISRGTYRSAPVTKVRLSLGTGRRHQLRLHAVAFKHPIVGDATYVQDEADLYFSGDRFTPPRMMLHSEMLTISLPPADTVLRGRKSRMYSLEKHTFRAPDPFVPERLLGLTLFSMNYCSAGQSKS